MAELNSANVGFEKHNFVLTPGWKVGILAEEIKKQLGNIGFGLHV